MRRESSRWLALLLVTAGCHSVERVTVKADFGLHDASDAGPRDVTSVADADEPDLGVTSDTGLMDTGLMDAGALDGGMCNPGCTEGCSQGCFDLGECTAPAFDIDVVANVETAGWLIDTATTARVYYRSGPGPWHLGPDSAVLPDGRTAGSVFGLAPSTDYELWVRYGQGAGLVSGCARFTTRATVEPQSTTRTLHVDDDAAPGGDGSMATPYRTISDAVQEANAGTDIRIAAGVYRESVRLVRSGNGDRYIRLIGEPGAILDGASTDGFVWLDEGDGVWSTPWAGDPRYASKDLQRLYHYEDLARLRGRLGAGGVTIDEGFVVEDGRLFVRVPDDPNQATFQVPALNTAVFMDGLSKIWIEGLEIRFYGEGSFAKGIDVRASDDVVVVRNYVHDVVTPIWVRRGSDNVRIHDNRVHQSTQWPWAAMKGTDHENSGIVLAGGRQAIVSHNEVHSIFNGIYAGSFSDSRDPTIAFDIDVYSNRMTRIGDDGLEPEGAAVNHRFRNNTIDVVHNGVSLAPITFGPTWVLNNRFTDYTESGFKVSNDSSGRVWLFHNTCYTDRPNQNGMNVSGPFTNMVFRNNAVRGTFYALEQTRPARPNDLDFNNWFTTRGAPVIKWSDVRYDDLAAWCAATGLECNGQPLAPMLVNPGAGRFAPTENSPNVDRGVRLFGINDDFEGGAPDLGYVELGATEIPPLP